jgi:hypothetical protein
MNEIDTYQNPLANGIYSQVEGVGFGSRYQIKPVVSSETAQALKDVLGGIDYRAKIEPEPGYGSVFEGLDFDSERLRSQSFALYDQEKNRPVGIMTAIVAPKIWVSNQRYFKRESGGARISDFKAITGHDLPDFLIIPAWTKVVPEHLGHFAIPGFRAFRRMMGLIQDKAPENTWMEAIAQGEWPVARRDELAKLTDQGVGAYIPQEDLPFSLDQIGKNNKGSSSSVKMAPVMGLKRIDGLGSSVSLGPSFAKRVK